MNRQLRAYDRALRTIGCARRNSVVACTSETTRNKVESQQTLPLAERHWTPWIHRS